MKTRLAKACAVVLGLCLATSGKGLWAEAALGAMETVGSEWHALESDEPTLESLTLTYSEAEAVSGASSGLFTISVPGVRITYFVDVHDKVHALAVVSGCLTTARQEGLPRLPCKTLVFEIPYAIVPAVDIIEEESVSLGKGFDILPAQPDSEDEWPAPDPEAGSAGLVRDTELYATDAFYPEGPVVLSEAGYLRERRVIQVKVFPVRYNPVTGELLAFSRLRFRIKYEGEADATGELRKQRHAIPETEAFAEHVLFNYSPVIESEDQSENDIEALGERGVEDPPAQPACLIIAADAASNLQSVLDMAAWKRDKGYRTWITSGSEIDDWAGGGNGNDVLEWWEVDEYIDHVYYSQDLPNLFYVLIVGECEGISVDLTADPWLIPARQKTIQSKTMYSDLWYADVDDPEPPERPYPEFVVARVSVRTEEHLDNALGKILQYDREPVAVAQGQPDWYRAYLGVAYFGDQDHPHYPQQYPEDGREDGTNGHYITTIAKFLADNIAPNGLIDQPWTDTVLLGLPYERNHYSREDYYFKQCCTMPGVYDQPNAEYRCRISQLQWDNAEMEYDDPWDDGCAFEPCKASIHTLDWIYDAMMERCYVANHIQNDLTDGQSLVIFRGHGIVRGWTRPPYNTDYYCDQADQRYIANLENNSKTPVVLTLQR